jgi:signal transduction histidine kinase
MRLSTKFILLITGTIAVPSVAMFFVALVAFASFSDRIGPWTALRTLSAIHELGQGKVELQKIPGILREASPAVDILIFDEERHPVFSSLPTDSLPDLFGRSAKGDTYFFHRFNVSAPEGRRYSVMVGFSSGNIERMGLQRFAPVVVLGSFLGFMILMSVFIIRSINVSIARLEDGTRRISEGDLDFELKAKGNDRIASLTRSFDRMRQQVSDERATRARFIMAVSHDLKTPLSSITGYLDAISDGMATEPTQLEKYLAIIRDKTGILESRISQLIDYVKLETAEWKRSREDVILFSFLDEAMTVFRTEAEARGFVFESTMEIPEGLAVSMDADLVYRALENLVHNAFRYAKPASTIGFRSFPDADGIILRISNRGEEIAEKDLPFIFEPFYRGGKTRRERGFGLGLSVVKSVVTSHGWTIDVLSREGETSFTISITA